MIEFIEWLEATLSNANERCMTGFSYVITQRLVREFGPWIEARCATYVAIQDTLDVAQEQMRVGSKPSSEMTINIRQQIEELNWDEPEDEWETMLSNGALETLEATLCLLEVLDGNTKPNMAAATGERLLNFVDYRLNMMEGIDDTYSAPDFGSEMKRQRELAETFVASSVEDVFELAQKAVETAPLLIKNEETH